MLLDLVLWPPTLISTTPIWLSLLFHHKPFFQTIMSMLPFSGSHHFIPFPLPTPYLHSFSPPFSNLFSVSYLWLMFQLILFLESSRRQHWPSVLPPHCKLSPRQFPTLFYMFPVCCPFHSPQHPSEVVLAPWHSGGNWGTEQWNSWSTVTGLVWGRTKLEPPCWSSEPIILQPFG